MKRFIILGLVLGMLLSGCATVQTMGKPPEEVTKADGKEVASEWWEIILTIFSLFPKGW